MFDFNSIYLFYALIGLSAAMFAEGIYLLVYNNASYRKNINRRLKVMDKSDRESVLVQLRRERGLTSGGDYRLPLINLNQLLLQSGLTIGFGRLILFIAIGAIAVFVAVLTLEGNVLRFYRRAVLRHRVAAARTEIFARPPAEKIQLPVSRRHRHYCPLLACRPSGADRHYYGGKEMKDPIGTEFGIVSDELTYGSDLETAMRNLYFRVGTDDLPLFVTAVAIQRSTGGNLGEILENLSSVIRQRFKMRRKIRALAAEGRASALILSSLPIGMFAVIQFLVPNFYARVWDQDMTKIGLGLAGCWMLVGNFIMYRMVNFRI